MNKRNFLLSALCLMSFISFSYAEGNKGDFVPIKGMTIGPNYIVFEAEATESSLGYWQIIRPGDNRYQDNPNVSPINETHLEFTGNDPNLGDPTSPLDYTFECPKTGTYRLGARLFQRLEGLPEDKCNDVYIRMSGNFTSGNNVSTDELKHDQKFYGRGVNEWGALYNLEAHEAGHAPAIYNLTEGEIYTLTVSGRAQRTNIDYWLLYETSLPITLQAHEDLAAENDTIYRPQVTNDSLVHPFIYATTQERDQILQNISNYSWAQTLVNQLHSIIDSEVSSHITTPSAILSNIPELADRDSYSESESSSAAGNHFKILSHASYAGMLYYLTEEEKYAQFAADILAHYIEDLSGRTPETTSICGNYFYDPRTTYPHFALAYDFIYHFLQDTSTRVFDLETETWIAFDNEKAQLAMKNIAGNALKESGGSDTHGKTISNHPVLTSPGALFPILCIDDLEERDRLFEVFWASGTKRQNSFENTILPMFGTQGIWPESVSYSFMPNISLILNVVDRIKPELKAAKNNQNIFNGAFLFENLRNPDRTFVRYGDSKRKTDITKTNYKYILDIAKRRGFTDLSEKADIALSQAYAAEGGRNEALSTSTFDNYSALSLFWGKELTSGNTESFDYKKTVVVEHAGVALQRNYVNQNNITYGLCGYIGGAHYVHSHLTGIAMELYGAGYVMAPNGGLPGTVAERSLPVHSDYFRLYAGNNTVIVNGTSHGKQDGAWKNDSYLWQNTTVNIASEPLHLEDPISEDFSFATQFLNDDVNNCDQQRTLSVIRTSPTTGYYLDIFRSKSNVSNNFHDYIYHNLGNSMHIMNDEYEDISVTATDRYQNDIGDPVHSPGWQFFEDEKVTDTTSEAVNIRFDINTYERYMHVKVPAGKNKEYTKALAPPTREAKNGYDERKTQLLAIRQMGEAWDQPYIVAFEPSTMYSSSVKSIEELKYNNKVVGAKVQSVIGETIITDFILSNEDNDSGLVLEEEEINFSGRFGIVRKVSKEDSTFISLYIGQGSRLNYQDSVLVANSKNQGFKSFYELDSAYLNNFIKIEAEDFDEGGAGVAYYDWDSKNYGDEQNYRQGEGVDLTTSIYASNGIVVSRLKPGEWLNYSFETEEENAYFFGMRTSNLRTDFAAVDISLDDSLLLNYFKIDKTGSWDDFIFSESEKSFVIDSGSHTIKVYVWFEDFYFDKLVLRKDLDYKPIIDSKSDQIQYITKVYPNPTNNILKIETVSNQLSEYTLYNLQGKAIKTDSFNKSVTIMLNKNLQGIHFLKVISRNNQSIHKVLIQ